ncbi:hypothetical protein FRC07_006454 [Ceratobasidium sp. 392]|nr:hypothetical protein FRC07_006454 [Ceratobasidium sp. 392]
MSLAQSTAKNNNRLLPSSQQLSSLPKPSARPATVKPASQPSPPPPRRSKRERRPSARQIESDEYQTNASRPPTPSASKAEPKSKTENSGKRGDRPGRIVQPAANVRTMSHESSPEPLAAPGSQRGDSVLAIQSPASIDVEVITREEGIRRASKYLGADASHLSNKSLKKVIEAALDSDEEDEARPMEPEGGSAPAVLQPARRMVLESGHELPATGTNDNIDMPQDSSARAALDQPRLGGTTNPDMATEPESEYEFIELRPEDSVSQRVPTTSHPPRALPIPHSLPATLTRDGSIGKGKQPDRARMDFDGASDGATDDGRSTTDSDHESEAAHVIKRQRLSGPAPVAHSRHIQTSHASLTVTRPSALSITRPPRLGKSSGGIPRSVQAKSLAAPRRVPTPFVAPGPSSALLPPGSSAPTSDTNILLNWITRLAKRAGTSPPDIDMEQLAQDLRSVRSRLYPAAPKSQKRTARSLKRPRDTDLIEDNAEVLEAEAALQMGLHARRPRKPALTDFPGYPHLIATRAIPQLIAMACTKGIYETLGIAVDWADECYKQVWSLELSKVPVQNPPYSLKTLMVHRLSWYRGEARGEIRPKTACFGFIDPPRTRDDLSFNINLAEMLLPNNFHCRDPKTGTDPYEHPALPKCIAATFFGGPKGIGTLHRERFSPMPLPAVAMVLTLMQHCIKEWKTGRREQITLKATKQLKMYRSHLEGLLVYADTAAGRMEKFRREWYEYGIAYAGVTPENDQPYQEVTRANQIRPDSPDSM